MNIKNFNVSLVIHLDQKTLDIIKDNKTGVVYNKVLGKNTVGIIIYGKDLK